MKIQRIQKIQKVRRERDSIGKKRVTTQEVQKLGPRMQRVQKLSRNREKSVNERNSEYRRQR